jgi:hypothetical protein
MSIFSKDEGQHPKEPGPSPECPNGSDLSIDVTSWGPNVSTIETLRCRLLDHPAVQEHLAGTRHRLLSVKFVETEAKTHEPVLSDRYRATVYDYTNNRTVFIDGCGVESDLVLVSESAIQPLPTQEEIQEAVEILTNHPELGRALREQLVQPYPAMPPLVTDEVELPDGRVQRTLAIGLLPNNERFQHEIVGINMINREVIRFERGAPRGSSREGGVCGIPYTQQPTTSNAPGQAWITVKQGGQVIWKFLAIRPAASSGTNGSGIELRYVDYRGKRVLYRGHVPILNVRYDNDACGPFRDWQNQEGMIQADGVDVVSGFRLASSPAKTFINTGSDAGNYLGVAIYVQGLEVVLVSEMEAGWYRYISEWRLHADGTIRPRFGFSAVRNSCVCHRHHHHVYWRLDFDIRTAGNNIVREFNDPPILGTSNWHSKYYEIKRPRDPARNRKWRVENTLTGEAYDIIPGPNDGVASTFPDWPFPVGDVWIMRYRGSEIDDGVIAIGPPYEAGVLNTWVNGAVINNRDVVIWYAGHATHDFPNEPPGTFGHIVGPELKPVNW